MTELLTANIRVLFPNNFVRRAGESVDVPAAEVLSPEDDLATMSDATLKARVESFLDMPEGSMTNMIVQRPEEGNILITAKTRFGGIDYSRTTYIIKDPKGKQVWAEQYEHLAQAWAMIVNKTKPGHTVEERPGNRIVEFSQSS